MELPRSEAVFLERYGRPATVLVSPDRYDQLMTTLGEAQDIAAFDVAMAEEGDDIRWEQVKSDLSWV